MFLKDFNDYTENLKLYGGNGGRKLGIDVDGKAWILKFPKTTRNLSKAVNISYTTSPLSEYLGSHIYEILGYDVHETMLGLKAGKLVVACKDFTDDKHVLREFREIKNYYNEKLEDMLEVSISSSDDDAHFTSLDALMIHLKYNPILQGVSGCSERFWECALIDGVINNNDRNNGNWGLLQNLDDNSYRLAPIFDNGGSFNNKLGKEEFKNRLHSEEAMTNSALNTVTSYALNNKLLTYKDFLALDFDGLKTAIIKVSDMLDEKIIEITDFITSIPETENDIPIISGYQKKFYIRSIELRIEKMLKPRYGQIEKNAIQKNS